MLKNKLSTMTANMKIGTKIKTIKATLSGTDILLCIKKILT